VLRARAGDLGPIRPDADRRQSDRDRSDRDRSDRPRWLCFNLSVAVVVATAVTAYIHAQAELTIEKALAECEAYRATLGAGDLIAGGDAARDCKKSNLLQLFATFEKDWNTLRDFLTGAEDASGSANSMWKTIKDRATNKGATVPEFPLTSDDKAAYFKKLCPCIKDLKATLLGLTEDERNNLKAKSGIDYTELTDTWFSRANCD